MSQILRRKSIAKTQEPLSMYLPVFLNGIAGTLISQRKRNLSMRSRTFFQCMPMPMA